MAAAAGWRRGIIAVHHRRRQAIGPLRAGRSIDCTPDGNLRPINSALTPPDLVSIFRAKTCPDIGPKLKPRDPLMMNKLALAAIFSFGIVLPADCPDASAVR